MRNKKKFNEFMNKTIDELKDEKRYGTAHIYQSTLNAFSEFCGCEVIYFHQLNKANLKEFETYLRDKQLSWNTVSTYMRTLRATYNKAVDKKIITENSRLFHHVYTGVKNDIKRALEVAASGGHNLIMIGSPGSGKSMMAKCMPSILPPLSLGESLETTKIHSVAGKLGKDSSLIAIRPFRSPHHTISQVAMVGGGTNPQPGEISLAHNGLLFLDELPEFNRSVLEVLRQPLEDRYISISRAKYSLDYPASFMLVASMNPCPCGYYNHPTRACVCNPGQVQRYLNRISGPLLDRIDIQIEIVPVPFEKMAEQHHAESSASIRKRVIKAREIQAQRFANHPGIYCNAQMEAGLLHLYAQPNEAGLKLLQTAMTRLNLSARAYGRILKVARTIADLDNSEHITSIHLAEAISYRNLDREDWAG